MKENEERDELLFNIQYNYVACKMTATLFGRLDKILSFTAVFLGGAVFADVKSNMWYGLIIAFCIGIQQVFKFSKTSNLAQSQCRAFLKLKRQAKVLDEKEIREQLIKIEESDINYIKSIELASMQRATISLDLTVKSKSELVQLTKLQKVIAWLAGDLPDKDYQQFVDIE